MTAHEAFFKHFMQHLLLLKIYEILLSVCAYTFSYKRVFFLNALIYNKFLLIII